ESLPQRLAAVLADVQKTGAALPDIPGIRILEKIGSGGFGAVFKAQRIGLETRFIAVKVLRDLDLGIGGQRNEKSLRQFQKEARILAQIEHPHVIRLYDAE